jgi:hypothetical protein
VTTISQTIRSSPEVFEPARRQLGVSHRVLDVAVAEVSLQRPRIVALVGQRKAARVAQHVRMSRKAQLGLDTSALHHASKACRRERRPALAGEHERRLGILLPLQLAQGPHFIADDGMSGRRALLGPPYVQDGVGEIDLIPTQVYKLRRPQAVAEGDEDHGSVTMTPAVTLGGIDQPVDLGAGQMSVYHVFYEQFQFRRSPEPALF